MCIVHTENPGNQRGRHKDNRYYSKNLDYSTHFDLRNPANKAIREELFSTFGLNPAKDYDDNCRLTNTIDSKTLIKSL